ncbi:hypothetical protein ETB97_009426, partial [Aspergillus alliaceus]
TADILPEATDLPIATDLPQAATGLPQAATATDILPSPRSHLMLIRVLLPREDTLNHHHQTWHTRHHKIQTKARTIAEGKVIAAASQPGELSVSAYLRAHG